MLEYISSITIERTPEAVFIFISDPSRLGSWRLDTERFEVLTPGVMVKGTRWIEHTTYLGQKAHNEIEVLEIQDGVQYTTRTMAQTVPFITTYRVEPAPEGSRFVIIVQGEVAGFLKLAEPLIRKQIVSSIESNLNHLKRVMETDN